MRTVAIAVGIIVWYGLMRAFVLGSGEPTAGALDDPMRDVDRAADSAFRAGALPRRTPATLSRLDSTVWLLFELRDEYRRAAGSVFTDSALAESRCGDACTPGQVDSIRLDLYRERAARNLSELGTLLPPPPPPTSSTARRVEGLAAEWQKFGFGLYDLLVVIVGAVVVALLIRYLPASND